MTPPARKTTEELFAARLEAALRQGRDQKEWLTNGPGACSECQARAAAGWIGISEGYPNEAAHDKCACCICYRTRALHEDD